MSYKDKIDEVRQELIEKYCSECNHKDYLSCTNCEKYPFCTSKYKVVSKVNFNNLKEVQIELLRKKIELQKLQDKHSILQTKYNLLETEYKRSKMLCSGQRHFIYADTDRLYLECKQCVFYDKCLFRITGGE